MKKEKTVFVELGNGDQMKVTAVREQTKEIGETENREQEPSFEEMMETFEKLGKREFQMRSTFPY